MAIKYPSLTGESATINSGDATVIDLAGTALTVGDFELRNFAQAGADAGDRGRLSGGV